MKVWDLHSDTLSELRYAENDGRPLSFRRSGLQMDLERMQQGDYLLQCFACFVNLGRKKENPLVSCLEQIDKFGGRHLLSQMAYTTRYAAVSFPGASLSGKEKGMPRNYEVHFMNIVDQDAWEIRKVKFPTELVFILKSKVFYEES